MTPRIAARFALCLCAMTAFAAPALACRYNRPANERISTLHRLGYVRGIVIVRVIRAGYTAPARRDYHPWEARASLVRVLRGQPQAGPFRFGRSGSSSACDDGLPPPHPGELWVLYLAPQGADRPGANLSYPLAFVRQADPIVARLLR